MADMTFEEMNEGIKKQIYDEVIQEFDYLNGTMLNDAEKQMIISDIVEYVFKESNELLKFIQTKYD